MIVPIAWGELIVRLGLGVGLVVACATNAKRVGGGAYLVATVGAVNVLLTLAFRVALLIGFEHSPLLALQVLDAGSTATAAILAFIGFLLLRG